MRILPVLTAILVTVFLFYLVIERDTLLAFAGATASEETPAANGETPAEEQKGQGVGVIAVHSTARNIDSAVILRGQTEADRQVVSRAETSGTVISTPLRKGAFVEAGQLLCELDAGTRGASLAEAKARFAEAAARRPEIEAQIPGAEARLEQARAALQEAQINENAARKLAKNGHASDTRVAAAEAALRTAEAGIKSAEAGVKSAQSGLQSLAASLQSAEAAVAAAEKEIERLSIKAPFAGLLENDTAELGSLLQPGAACATILQLDPIKLVGFVPETQIARVSIGAQAGARLTTGQTVQGKVSFLGRSADPLTRTFRVEIEIPNPDLEIRDGQTTEIIIASAGRKAHLVPSSALTLDDNGRLGVRLVTQEQTAKFMPVTLLRDSAEGSWLAGLPDDADIIVIGQEYVIDGVKLRPSYEALEQ